MKKRFRKRLWSSRERLQKQFVKEKMWNKENLQVECLLQGVFKESCGKVKMNTIIVDENKIDSIFYHDYKWYDPPVIDDFCFDKFKILLPLWKLKCVVELMNGTKRGKNETVLWRDWRN